MTTPYFTSVLSGKSLDQQYSPSSARGRPRGSLKRGRKPRGAGNSGSTSPRPFVPNALSTSPAPASAPSNTNAASAQYPRVHWALPTTTGVGSDETAGSSSAGASGTAATSSSLLIPNVPSTSTSGSHQPLPTLDLAGLLSLNPTPVYRPPILSTNRALDEDGEGEDELLPAMADDDYSAQLSWQSQSKDNLKYVISLLLEWYISHN